MLPPPAVTSTARPPADRVMRRLLRVETARKGSRSDLHQAFRTSIVLSATRCTLTYIVLPFAAPAIGFATGVGPWIGVPLGTLAILSNGVTMRRFWAADHKWRWPYTVVSLTVIVLLLILMGGDVADLAG